MFRTTDAGATWTNVTGNLGTLNIGTIRSVAVRNVGGAAVMVGTEVGVFAANGPGFNAWGTFGCGLPRVPVFDLEFDAQDRVFVAGTLGRGAWVLRDN